MSDLEYPADLRYTSDHEWVKETGEGTVRIGITDYAQDALGDVVFVELPKVGRALKKAEAAAVVDRLQRVGRDPQLDRAAERVGDHRDVEQVRQEPPLGLAVRVEIGTAHV